MTATLESDASTKDRWKHIIKILFWLFHCSNCENLEEEIWDPNANSREVVQFT
jgi:hypothetical protein